MAFRETRSLQEKLDKEIKSKFNDPFFLDEEYEKARKTGWVKEKNRKIADTFDTEYHQLISAKEYFFGCPIFIYKTTFEKRKSDFKQKYPDALDIDFIESEFRIGVNIYHHIYPFEISKYRSKNIYYSLERRKEFLEEKAKQLGYHITFDEDLDTLELYLCKIEKDIFSHQGGSNSKFIKSDLKWKGTQTELMELIKALIENESLSGKQKDIINLVSNFFNITINNPDKLLTDIKKRNIGSETLFLDKLKSTLYNYISKENKR